MSFLDRAQMAVIYFAPVALIYRELHLYFYEYQMAPDPRYHFMMFFIPLGLRAISWLVEQYREVRKTLVLDYMITVLVMVLYMDAASHPQFQGAIELLAVLLATLHVGSLVVAGFTLQDTPYSYLLPRLDDD